MEGFVFDVSTSSCHPISGLLFTNETHGYKVAYEYNGAWNVVKTIYPDGSCSETIHDGPRVIGQISRTSLTNWFGYDLVGRRIAVTNSLEVLGSALKNKDCNR